MADESTVHPILFGRNSPDSVLTVEVYTASDQPPAWIVDVMCYLSTLPFVRLCGRRQTAGPAPAPGFAARLYQRLCQRLGDDPWRPTSVPHDLIADAVAEPLPDVALYIGDFPASAPCAGLARLVVLSLLPGTTGNPVSSLLTQVCHEGALGFVLYRHERAWNEGIPLRDQMAPRQGSYNYVRAASQAFSAAAHLAARTLLDLVSGRPIEPIGPAIRLSADNGPGVSRLLAYLPRVFGGTLAANLFQRSKRKQWFSAWRPRTDRDSGAFADPLAGGFHVVQGRSGLGYADPFPFHHDGRDYLFIEEILPDERGRLVVAEVTADGLVPDPPTVILDRPYHLSYPMVFAHEGEVYLIPESTANGAVDLYRAARLPDQWVLDQTLVRGQHLVDTTPWLQDGLWYFFVCTSPSAHVPLEGRLYVADTLRGAWREHPASPISVDPRTSRAAGRVFRQAGKLYRVVQDCLSDYGLAVRVMEIDELTPTAFREHEVAVYTTDWHPEAIRTHTWNADGGIEAIDGSRWRSR